MKNGQHVIHLLHRCKNSTQLLKASRLDGLWNADVPMGICW